MNKKSFFSCVLLLCALPALATGELEFSFADDFEADLQDLTNQAAQLNEELRQQTRATACSDERSAGNIVLGLLLADFQKLLVFNAYQYTNPIVVRSLHDLPSLKPWYGCQDSLCFYGTFFYNQMNKAYLTKNSPALKCYLSVLHDDEILTALKEVLGGVGIDVPFDQVLPLFTPLVLQQRRLGAMIGASKCFGSWRFNLAAPLYYLEYNFFLTQKEVNALVFSPFFSAADGGYQPENPEDFITHHLIGDKVGIGDFRFYADYTFFNETRNPLRLGAQLTLPNSTVIGSAILGNTFDASPAQPPFSFQDLFELKCLADGSTDDPHTLEAQYLLGFIGQTAALAFFDRLSSNLIENSLGQRQASYGILLEYQGRVTDSTALHLFFEWDQFVPGIEKRMMKMVISPDAVLDISNGGSRNYASQDPTVAEQNLTFLQQQVVNILYPPFVPVKVHQGDTIKGRAFSVTTWHALEWALGFDVWLQLREKLTPLCNTFTLYGPVDLPAATKPAALQGKVFGQLTAISHKPTPDTFGWRTGLRAEITTNSFGIGKDWLLGIDFTADF